MTLRAWLVAIGRAHAARVFGPESVYPHLAARSVEESLREYALEYPPQHEENRGRVHH